MRKLNKVLLLLIVLGTIFTINTKEVQAASFSVSTSSSSVSAGGQATITITASDCGGQFSISASGGAKVSSGSLWIENGSSSVTVTAPNSGSFSVTVTASDVANSAGTDVVTGSKSVSMSVKEAVVTPSTSTPSTSTPSTSTPSTSTPSTSTPSTSTPSTSTPSTSTNTATESVSESVAEEVKSAENTLSKLTVDNGTLSPEFSATKTNYSVDVKDLENITISATAKDSKATVSGVGKKELESGENTFSVVVTAENGSKKTYKITVTVKYSPTVFISINDSEFGVVNNPEDIKIPSQFEESTHVIGEEEVSSWVDTNSGIEIICLIEEDTEALYVVEEGVVISKFTTMSILGKNVYVLDIATEDQDRSGLVFEEVEVDGNVLMGWSFEREELSSFSLIRLVLKNGDTEEYLYSSKSNTMIYMDYETFVNTSEIEEAIYENEELIKANSILTNANDDLTNMKLILSIVCGVSIIGLGASAFVGRGYKKDYLALRKEYGVDEDFIDTEEFACGSDENNVPVKQRNQQETHKIDLNDFNETEEK